MQPGHKTGKRTLGMFALLGAIGVTSLAGCEREVVVEHPHGCRDAVWVRGHHNRYGYWRPGHWVCGPRRHVVVVGVVE